MKETCETRRFKCVTQAIKSLSLLPYKKILLGMSGSHKSCPKGDIDPYRHIRGSIDSFREQKHTNDNHVYIYLHQISNTRQ